MLGGTDYVCNAPCAVAARDKLQRGVITDKVAALLKKILEFGFEALTLDELSSVHVPLCSATGRMIVANPGLRLSPVKTSLQGADQYHLCGRIYRLEQEIMRKEQASQKKVCCLESTMAREKQRLHDLKRALAEHEHNSAELHSRLGSQRQVQGDLEAERDSLRNQGTTAIQLLEREKNKNCRIENELQIQLNNNRILKSMLEAERNKPPNSNIKESDRIETMYGKVVPLQHSSTTPTNEAPHRSLCSAPCNTSLQKLLAEKQTPTVEDHNKKELFYISLSKRMAKKPVDRLPSSDD